MAEVLKKKEIHVFNRFRQKLAFDVNDMHLFEINQLTKEIFQQVDEKTPDELTAVLSDYFPPSEVLHVLGQLMKLNLVGYRLPNRGDGAENAEQDSIQDDGTKRLVLFVTQDCNLECRYCLTRKIGGIQKKHMSEEVARAAVNLLFQESNNIENLDIGFYGGEPMLELDLIKRIILYTNRKAVELHKTVKYTMTTNGTLLTDEAIEFLAENKVNTTVSLDGSRKIHDKDRVFPDGSGSFAKVFPAFIKLKEKANGTRTLSVMRSFDVPMKDIAQSLLDSGISNIKIAPASSSNGELEIPVSGDGSCDSVDIYNKQFEEMILHFLDNEMIFQEKPPIEFAKVFGYLDKRKKRATNCGAACNRFAVDAEGNILPCDSFIAEPAFYMGNVLTGLDRSYRETFKEMRAANSETCRACWARHLCGGWCPFFSLNQYSDLKKPVDTRCRITKNYLEIALGVYSLFKRRKKSMPQNQNREVHNAPKS